MDQSAMSLGTQVPLLIIPKHCTNLETNFIVTDNVLIDVNITSRDTESHETCVYSGLCNVKLIENFEVDIQLSNTHIPEDPTEFTDNENLPVINDVGQSSNGYSVYNQNKVWIDPSRSPYVYNHCNMESHDFAVNNVYHTQTNHITVKEHNTYITQNVYKYKDSYHYSPEQDYESPQRTKQTIPIYGNRNNELNISTSYEDDEFACGVFLSQLQEEILNETKTRAREERKYIDLNSGNEAINQLMSSSIQSVSKQRKTILFLGHDSHFGHTVQKITVNDPTLKCRTGYGEIQDVSSDDHRHSEALLSPDLPFQSMNPHQKKYQCDKCNQIFDQIAAFKQHMVGIHKEPKNQVSPLKGKANYMCSDCGKTLKTQKKYQLHCMGHGNSELECNECHKVFASKFTLRTHRRIHERKFHCAYCTKSYVTSELLDEHTRKIHRPYNNTGYVASNEEFPKLHKKTATMTDRNEELVDSLIDDGVAEDDMASEASNNKCEQEDAAIKRNASGVTEMMKDEVVESANNVIAKVMSNKVFLLHSQEARKHKKYNKVCDVCNKQFGRVSDLKRHLIEHVIRSTLAKSPVSTHGTLIIQCEVCQQKTFTKIDKYKAHLREHAKLTIYKCTFCDKSFSDSSNFSKHKKIHSTTYFQCDMCLRKFNSKKMIAQHMEYHRNHPPVTCKHCDEVFYFESKLKKHIKSAHTKELTSRFKCRFCRDSFTSLKYKWDHEWNVHSARNYILDCVVCGFRFRKYTELRRHCINYHNIEIPQAKNFLQSAIKTDH